MSSEKEGKELLRAIKKNDMNTIISIITTDGFDLDKKYNGNKSALVEAVKTGQLNIVSRLVKAGADVDARDSSRNSALHWAAYDGHLSIAKLLLSGGADPDIMGNENKSPLDRANERGHDLIVSALISKTENKRKHERQEQYVEDYSPRPWEIIDGYEIAHVHFKKQINQKITEVFNFKSNERTTTILDMKEKVQSTCREKFTDVANIDDIKEAANNLSIGCGNSFDVDQIFQKSTEFVGKKNKKKPVPLKIPKAGGN